MKKLAKYLRPYLGLIVLCVALLFGQTVCDLTLPNLMSDIVNVGIQQGGVEESAPKAISRQGLSFLEVFLSGEDAARLEGCYETVAAGSDSILTDSYPAAAQEDICVLREGGETEAQELFGKAAAAMTKSAELMMEQAGTGSEPSGGEAQDAQTGETQMDVQALYSMQPLFEQLPQETMEETRSYAQALDSSMREQIATALIRPFYEELGVDTDGMRSGYILRVGLQMLLVTLAGAACTILVGFNASRIAAGVARSMRRDVFATVESFGSAEFDRYSTASLITRTTNDITQVQMLIVMGLRLICYAPIMAIGGSAMALQKSVSMSGIIVVGALFLIGIIAVVFSISRPKFQMVQKLIDRLNLVTRENLSGMMVIRAFGTQEQEEKRFDKSNRDLTSVNLFVNRVMVFLMPAMMFCMNAINLVIVWVGAHQIEAAAMQVGDMMAFMQYAMQVIMSFLMISMMFIMVPRAAVAGDRVAEVLETVPSVQDPVSPKRFGPQTGGVEFRHVSFRYDGAQEDTLHDITFTAKPGETTAFIGATGSGKSTMVNLVPRFYDATEGQVLVGGLDVREVTQKDLRERIGFVPQKGNLFSGTIRSNLAYGSPKATDEDVRRAASVAQASEFIEEKPQGFDEPIAQGGGNVSGGQKQRLAIGRALTKKASVYVFDDSFSALDFKTDAALRRALREYTKDAAVLLVAQRVSTIMNAEQIIVLDGGRIVGKGTHKELLASCPTYREIAVSQLSEEELQ